MWQSAFGRNVRRYSFREASAAGRVRGSELLVTISTDCGRRYWYYLATESDSTALAGERWATAPRGSLVKGDAQAALIKGGLQSTPYGSVLQNWMRACQSLTPGCQQGTKALHAYTVGIATTDAK
jgi:hypothetical protein